MQLKQCSLNEEAATKRQIASTLGSVFDPIGVFSPILMQSKLFIRSLCKAKVDWDQPFDEEFLKSWKSFCGNFEAVSSQRFPRRTFNSDSPSSFVYLLMPLRRLMDVSFMLFKMNKDTCSFQRLKLVR